MEHTQAWYRHKRVFIVFSLLIISLAIFLPVAALLFHQSPPPRNLTYFNCRLASGTEKFVVSEEVDLTDEMTEDEARKVATCVLREVNERDLRQTITSTKISSILKEGIWNVTFHWDTFVKGYFPGDHPYGPIYWMRESWSLEVLIDPLTLIVAYKANEAAPAG